MNEAVDRGQRHGGIGEHLVPFAEGLIGGDQHGAPFVAGADQFEQHAGLRLVLGDVGEVVEDQQVEPVEAVEGRLEREFASGHLQLLDEVGGAGEQHLPTVLHERQADRRRKMALTAAGRPPLQLHAASLRGASCRLRPKSKRLAPVLSQASPAATAIT